MRPVRTISQRTCNSGGIVRDDPVDTGCDQVGQGTEVIDP